MAKRVAILQSNYIPWKGYFDIINSVDLFVFHDDLQYTKGDWRNRNKIKTSSGSKWLTVPCGTSQNRLINEVMLTDSSWQKKHWSIICQNYRKAEYFSEYREFFEDIFLSKTWLNLSDMNQYIIKLISKKILDIDTSFEDSAQYNLQSKKEERVIELLKILKADVYLSGCAAKDYLSDDSFRSENIKLEWMSYNGYIEYNQLSPPFDHNVTILDLIFNEGPNAKKLYKKNLIIK